MEIVCLDTNILVDHKRAVEKDKTRLIQLASQGYYFKVTSISVYELFRGDKSKEDAHWKSFFSKVDILDFDYKSAQIAGDIYRDLKNKGKLLDVTDILIAAITIRNELKLATDNIKHFSRVNGLKIL